MNIKQLSPRTRKAIEHLRAGAQFCRRLETNPFTQIDKFQYRLIARNGTIIKGFGFQTFCELEDKDAFALAGGATSGSTYYKLREHLMTPSEPVTA